MNNEFENYQTDGYVLKENFYDASLIKNIHDELVFTHDEVLKKLLQELDANLIIKNDLAIENHKIKYLKNANIYFDSVRFLIDSNLYAVAKSLINDNVFIDGIELHQKYPGGSLTPPHQDNFYFCLKNAKALTAYIPLNDQGRENGGLAVVPKSHLVDFDHSYSNVVGFSSGLELTKEQLESVKHYSLKPGDLSIHHCNIIHLAPENLSSVPRINIAIRFRAVTETKDLGRVERYESFRSKSLRISS